MIILEAQLASVVQPVHVRCYSSLTSTPVAVERLVYTFESTSLLLQPHSQFVRGENVVKIPVHH